MVVRALGVAAIAGGVLRVISSFTTHSFSPATLAALYFVTDVLLLLGIAGLYWSLHSKLSVTGVVGLAIFVVGIVLIRISAGVFVVLKSVAIGTLDAMGYQIGAAIALLGLAIFSAEELLRRDRTNAAAILWLAAFLFAVVGVLGVMTAIMTIAAGVAFGAGFVMAGRRVLLAA
jgi:hypothetical protein